MVYFMQKRGNLMGKIHNVEKMTDNRFVNLYHVDATSVHNTPVSYYVASRANDVPSLKLKTGRNDPDGVIIYSIYGEKKRQSRSGAPVSLHTRGLHL